MKPAGVFLVLFYVILFACHPAKKITSAPMPDQRYTPPPVADTVKAPLKQQDTTVVPVSYARTSPLLQSLLASHPEYFKKLMEQKDSFRLQVVYTQIDRKADNTPEFSSFYYNVDSLNYFYPASTVKMPVALLALQRLRELRIPGLASGSTMITGQATPRQTPVYNDPTTPDGRPSIAQYIRKIFLVSDNDAFNRLYEFLGPKYINERLHAMGYEDAEIRHRLAITLNEDENRHTNPVNFYTPAGQSLYTQPMQFSSDPFFLRNEFAGTKYYNEDTLVPTPMSFAKKNRISLEDLTNVLKSILFPASVPEKQRFSLDPADQQLVLKYMSQVPSETVFPYYDPAEYHDAYVKFLLYGSEKGPLSPDIRIFNKVGDAYGFLTDVAYIADFKQGIEFMVSATLYCNSDGIINDNKYDYDTVGFPFMKNLGRVLYEYELKRPHRKPDLSAFKLTYDKPHE